MISIDDRIGSSQLAPMLRQIGMEVELTRMDFGDVAFFGLGHGQCPVSVGVECKTLDDCLACITSGRFAGHQLPGMIKSYDHIWLLIQGEWRANAAGVLEHRRIGRGGGMYWAEAGGGQRRWMWRDFEGWVNSVTILGGMRVHRVTDWREGAQWIKCLWNWFQRDEHKSVQVVYGGKQLYAEEALLVKPNLARRVAKELPGIGIRRSLDVSKKFHTVEEMASASLDDWATLVVTDKTGETRYLGKAVAAKVYKAIHQNGTGGIGK